MRLLSTKNLKLANFHDDKIPPYAILSHTWCEKEVTFEEWETIQFSNVSQKEGYMKIKKFCEQAAIDRFDWVWIDTYVHPNLCKCSG
jgi:hypothetical protein